MERRTDNSYSAIFKAFHGRRPTKAELEKALDIARAEAEEWKKKYRDLDGYIASCLV